MNFYQFCQLLEAWDSGYSPTPDEIQQQREKHPEFFQEPESPANAICISREIRKSSGRPSKGTMMDFKYGIIAVKQSDDPNFGDIVHFCGYEQQPTDADMRSLADELATDEEHGLVEIADQLTLIAAPENVVQYYREKVEGLEIDVRFDKGDSHDS